VLAALAAIAAASGAGASVARGALLPPRNPAHSLALDEHVQPDCSGVRDQSATCLDESVAMLNAGRRSERLGPLVLPRNWGRLTVAEQTFVITELERTARGLQPDTGLAADWNAAALAGADAGTDPTRAGAGAHGGFLSIWAGGQPNPIVAMAGWIYDDGYYPDRTTQNIACSRATPSGCWGHRDAILRDTAATACDHRCAVGAAYSASGYRAAGSGGGHESYAEVFGIGAGNNPDPLMFRWAAELPELPACERARDSCSWTGRPLVTAGGLVNVRGVPPGTSLVRPWFSVSIRWSSNSDGAVSLAIGVGLRLGSVNATATQGTKRVTLAVSRRGSDQFVATGQLASGQWTVTIGYGTPAVDGPRPSSTASFRVP
jgi:hypothetical protein